jgi:hypothetical protein
MDARQYTNAGFSTKQVGPDGVPLYTFVITTDRMDRQGEIVTVDGWDFTSYLTNPVVLDSHSYESIESIVGRCVAINQDANGWTADIRFNDSEYGALARSLVDGGDLRAVSVGFRPLAIEYPDMAALRASRSVDDETMKAVVSVAPDPSIAVRHVRKELLEISVVPIPANADAIRIRSMVPHRSPVVDNVTRGAIPYRKTGLAPESQSWDGPAETAKASVDDLKRMCAWVDPERADVEAGYKLAHHTVAGPYDCVWRGVAQCMSIMFGGRGGVMMPDADRKPVYDHLAKHYTDFGREAPAWKAIEETRIAALSNDADTIPVAGFADAVWPLVASAMLAVLTDTETTDAVRRRAYNGLERVYKALDKEPPDYVPADTVAKLGMAERFGLFWEGEADHAKAGRVLSGSNEMRLRQALDLITQVLASLGGGDAPAPEVPAPTLPYGGEGLAANLDALKAFLEKQ